eukprot:7239131-Prymnesium_polylepis.1
MRLVAAHRHRAPLAESDGRAPSSSVTRLRGNFFMLRDPVDRTAVLFSILDTQVPTALHTSE